LITKETDTIKSVFPSGAQGVHPDQRWKITADIVSIFSDIWKLGQEPPRLLYYLRAALRLLLNTPNTTLLDVRRVLADVSYRNGLLRACGDPETRQTWKEFSGKKEQQQAMEIGSLQNKIAALADPLPLRYILGQPSSTLSITNLLLKGDNLVVDLSDIGDEPAALICPVTDSVSWRPPPSRSPALSLSHLQRHPIPRARRFVIDLIQRIYACIPDAQLQRLPAGLR
jgi:hypothetical protein